MPRPAPSRPPPFCPNPACVFHRDPRVWRYTKKGFYARAAAPRRIQRYRCSHCGRNFSTQTFSVRYWLKRPELLGAVFHRILSCSALRQIAQEFAVAHTTILRQVERLGRHCLLFHERLRPRRPPEGVLVLDGFHSFESGHYWPFEAPLVVGASHYVYGFQEAELRRSGTMRPGQRRQRAALEARHGRPDRRAPERAVAELVGRVVPRGAAVTLWSDDHAAYPRALARVPGRRIRHRTISAKARRTSRNPLFPVNLADLLIRHTGANHKRETIAFSKRRQGAMYRLAIWAVWRNYVKWRSERRRDATPAQALGILGPRLGVPEVLGERLFPSRVRLSGWLRQCYERRIPTRCLPRGPIHRAVYAR